MRFLVYHANLAVIFFCLIAMAILVLALPAMLSISWPDWTNFPTCISGGMVLSWALSYLFHIDAYEAIRSEPANTRNIDIKYPDRT